MWKLNLLLNFRQLSVWLRDLPQVFVNQQDLQSSSADFRQLASTFRAAAAPFANFPCIEVPSINFPYVRGCSINFRQLSVHSREYPSNFCVSEEHFVIIIKHYVQPWDLPSTSINFSCVCASEFLLTFQRDLLSTFLASAGRSVYLC